MVAIPFFGFAEPVSSISHLFSAFAAFVGTFVLISKGRGNAARVTAMIIFSFSLVFLFSMSGVFHMLDYGSTARAVLRRLDHTGIWVMIAGTFTPIHVFLFRGVWRWGILLLVWLLAITGLVLEVVYFNDFPEWLLLSFFLCLGWIGAFSGLRFRKLFSGEDLTYLGMGGVCYSVGAILDFAKYPTLIPGVLGAHEIFHFFVMAGCFCHWMFIYHWCDYPVTNSLSFRITILPSNRVHAEAIGDHIPLEAESIGELKKKILETVRGKFHQSVNPKVRLIYAHEDHFHLNDRLGPQPRDGSRGSYDPSP
jgi:channel protein (hemolysin III family)